MDQWAPWRHEIHFSNGVKTSDCETIEPFTPQPWSKIKIFESRVELPKGGTALDIGCNGGYNALYLQKFYGMTGTGIDFMDRHVEVSTFLNELAGYNGFEFVKADANFFERPSTYDLIIHFGTLYHLKHPVLSLERCTSSLKPGGLLALETQCFGEGRECLYIRGHYGDDSNWFALGPGAVIDILHTIGLAEVKQIFVWHSPKLEPGMSRRCFVAGKTHN